MFDLTSLLTTIAGSSATLAAIIGGFIVSKLIALNTERAEIKIRIQEVDEEIAFRDKKIIEMRQSVVEDDAIDFITEHVDELIDEISLDAVYSKIERRPELGKEELDQYWNRARDVIRKLREFIVKNGYHPNDDSIPSGFAVALPDFEYQICESVMDAMKKRLKSSSPKTSYGGILDMASLDFGFSMPRIKGYWYQKTKDDMHVNLGHLEWLQVQKRQLETRQKALKQSKGIMSGLLVFLIVVLVGVLAPLTAVPLVVDDYQTMLKAKWLYVTLFLVTLSIVFWYFIDLVRWKDSTANKMK